MQRVSDKDIASGCLGADPCGWSIIRRGIGRESWRHITNFSNFPTLKWVNSEKVWNGLYQTLKGFA